MLRKIASILFILTVFGVLIALRFSVPDSVSVIITDSNGSTAYQKSSVLKRGQFVKTGKGEYLAIQIGASIQLWLDENTTIELKRTYVDERSIGFTRGRIVVESTDQTPLLIETKQTQNIVQNAVASFVNYDFRDTISVIPFEGSVESGIKKINKYFLIPKSVNIHEIPPFKIEPIEFKKDMGVYATFYDWVGK